MPDAWEVAYELSHVGGSAPVGAVLRTTAGASRWPRRRRRPKPGKRSPAGCWGLLLHGVPSCVSHLRTLDMLGRCPASGEVAPPYVFPVED